jgi:hypothetical protein
VQIAREIRHARAVALDQALSITHEGGYWRFTLPTLKAYEVVLLD